MVLWYFVTVDSCQSPRHPTKVERGARWRLRMRRRKRSHCSREREMTGLMWVGMLFL